MDFLVLGAFISMRQFRISQEKHLSSGFQNLLLSTWLEKATNMQFLAAGRVRRRSPGSQYYSPPPPPSPPPPDF